MKALELFARACLIPFGLIVCAVGYSIFAPAACLGEPICGWSQYPMWAHFVNIPMGAAIVASGISIATLAFRSWDAEKP